MVGGKGGEEKSLERLESTRLEKLTRSRNFRNASACFSEDEMKYLRSRISLLEYEGLRNEKEVRLSSRRTSEDDRPAVWPYSFPEESSELVITQGRFLVRIIIVVINHLPPCRLHPLPISKLTVSGHSI